MKLSGLVALAMISGTAIFGQTPSKSGKETNKDFENLPNLQWKFTTKAPFFSTPVIADGTVYVGCLDRTLYALELFSGKLKWKYNTGGEIRSTVCLSGERLFLYSGDGTL